MIYGGDEEFVEMFWYGELWLVFGVDWDDFGVLDGLVFFGVGFLLFDYVFEGWLIEFVY